MLPFVGRRALTAIPTLFIVTLMVFFYIFFNLVVDVLYAYIDPRIRLQ